jgi:hypothetical protein
VIEDGLNKLGLFSFMLVCVLYAPFNSLSYGDTVDDKSNKPTSDLAIIAGKKFTLNVNDNKYNIYYGIILGESSKQDYNAVITYISVVPEKKSLLINFDNILQTDNVWVRFPNEVISAEGEKFVLFVDGIEKGYELSSHGSETRLGFIIPQGTHEIEIVGNNVIPEFPTNMLLVFLMVFCIMILLTRNYTKSSTPY